MIIDWIKIGVIDPMHPGCVLWQYVVYSHGHPPNFRIDHQSSASCDHSCLAYHHRLDQYCHRSLLHDQDRVDNAFAASKERVLPVAKKGELQLVQVHIVARHGDRSPFTPYILGSPLFYDCGLMEDKGSTTWTRLRDFAPLQGLRHGDKVVHPLHQFLYPGPNSKQCGLGMLTKTGFHQHKALGAQLRKKYAQVLFGNSTGKQVVRSLYVQSTDYLRTIQSAAAFMLGFLPDQQALRKRVTIFVSPGSRLEAPPPGVETIFKPCKYYDSFKQSQLVKSDYFKTEKTKYHPLLEKISHMFRLHDVQNRPVVTKVFDSIATRGCHSKDDPLPCYMDQCLDYDLAFKLFDFTDWSFSNFCTREGSLVGLIPFLRHSVLGLMEGVTKERANAKRFVLSLSHDNTMTRLMLALGIRLEKLMPYASRITFELWKARLASAKEEAFQVRVLFNGIPVTRKLAAWENAADASELLPYHLWKSYLENGIYRDTQSYNNVCSNLKS